MNVLVEEHPIAFLEKGGKDARIRLIAAGKEKRRFIAEVTGVFFFRTGNGSIITGNKSRGRGRCAAVLKITGYFFPQRRHAKSQIVVGREIEHLLRTDEDVLSI